MIDMVYEKCGVWAFMDMEGCRDLFFGERETGLFFLWEAELKLVWD